MTPTQVALAGYSIWASIYLFLAFTSVSRLFKGRDIKWSLVTIACLMQSGAFTALAVSIHGGAVSSGAIIAVRWLALISGLLFCLFALLYLTGRHRESKRHRANINSDMV